MFRSLAAGGDGAATNLFEAPPDLTNVVSGILLAQFGLYTLTFDRTFSGADTSMDERITQPGRTTQTLLRFPSELTELITSQLFSDELVRLWMCGDTALVHRLMTGGVQQMRHVHVWRGPQCHNVILPKFLYFFPSLRSLTISLESYVSPLVLDYIETAELDLESLKRLPPSVESISFISPRVDASPRPLDLMELFNALPKLNRVRGLVTREISPAVPEFRSISSRLTCIETHAWHIADSILDMCVSLVSLRVSGFVYAPCLIEGRLMRFPDSLTSLSLGGTLKMDLDLEFGDSMAKRGLRVVPIIPQWPESLTSLELNDLWEVSFMIHMPDLLAASLPTGLLQFKTNATMCPEKFMEALPKSLTRYEAKGSIGWPSADRGGLGALPRGLRFLRGLGECVSDEDLLLLPKSLVSMQIIPSTSFSPDDNILPPHLTELHLMEVPHRCIISDLPSTLLSLSISASSPMYTVKQFPPNLTYAKLYFGMQQHVEMTLALLPSTLHSLILDHRQKELDSDWTACLPKELKLFHFLGIMSDENIKHLPRQLNILSIHSPFSSYYQVTSKCLKDLPNSIASLSLVVKHFVPEHLAGLPRSCTQAQFHSPSHGELSITMPMDIKSLLPTRLRYLFIDWAFSNKQEAIEAIRPIQFDCFN